MNIPNFLTLIRLLLIPVFIKTFYDSPNYFIPFSVFIVAGATDVLDGYIARKYNLITKWGQIFDPIADKLLQISVLFVLTDKGVIPLWIIIVIILKELFLMIGSIVAFKNKIIVQAKWYGKAATVLFYIAIILYMISANNILGTCSIILAVIAALYSAMRYTMYYYKMIKEK